MDPSVINQILDKIDRIPNDPTVTLTPREVEMIKTALKEGGGGASQGSVRNTAIPGSDNVKCVEEAMETGMCYLRLLYTLPSFKEAPEGDIIEVVGNLKRNLGRDPKGSETIIRLTTAELFLNGKIELSEFRVMEQEMSLDHQSHLNALYEMMKSKCTFSFEESGGKLHISSVNLSCSCNSVLCDHGWSSKFMLCILTRENQIVGSELDIEAFFSSGVAPTQPLSFQEQPRMAFQNLPPESNYQRIASQVPHMSYKEEMSRDVGGVLTEELNKRPAAFKERPADLARVLKGDTIEERTTALEKLLSGMLQSQDETVVADCEESEVGTIRPFDSSSNLSRYPRRYMTTGSVYSPGRAGTTLEPLAPRLQGISEDIVQGFVKTESMQRAEEESLAKVRPINGLAAPFKSSRLNLLVNLHSMIGTNGNISGEDLENVLKWASKKTTTSPSEVLVQQILARTFDFERSVVIANPFTLPYLEVGMCVTGDTLRTMFILLLGEYKLLWFQEVKGLIVPSFHDEFRREDRRSSRHKQQAEEAAEQRVIARQPRRESSSSGRVRRASLLGF